LNVHRWTRPVVLVAVCALCLTVDTIVAAGGRPAIRPLDPSVEALLAEGYQRSATLLRLADDLARTDGIVYIQSGRCPIPGLRACLLHSIKATGSVRYVWIRIRPEGDPDTLMASIAHELQHALEVLRQPWIRNRWDVLTFYRSGIPGAFGTTPQGSPVASFETGAAVDVTVKVRAELAASVEAAADVER
jgi:hypothetical protein